MRQYKNIIFDLGGVVVARDSNKCTRDFLEFFEYIHYDPMPTFWSEYDRGIISFEQVQRALSEYRGVTLEFCKGYVNKTITMQEEVLPTKELITKLKEQGYRLYVLSNMACEYIQYIRTLPVYKNFDGEIISSEEGYIKPEREIYEITLERYNLNAAESLFIDDREANIIAAQRLGIDGVLFNAGDPESSCDEIAKVLL